MSHLKRRSLLMSSVALAAAAASPRIAKAQNASYTAADLKSTLNPFGGLRAGNAEGTIPAWTGDLVPLPAGYVPGSPRPDPFPDEKPLYSITAANAVTYQDKLSEGVQEMFKRYPDYRIDVYPTRRTAIAPQYVYDYTYKNATRAQIAPDGNSISGAYGGIPFPIPANGKQVMWNHELSWKGVSIQNAAGNMSITSNGQQIVRTVANLTVQFPYYFEGGETSFDGIYQQLLLDITAPAYQVGANVLLLQPVNPVQNPPRAWSYLPGQRRTRLAPELEYDTPDDSAGGIVTWDQGQVFYGPLDQYDCKLIGKKEMIVPYNANRAWTTPVAAQYGPKFYNPDALRWELHRVWVVEMTLAAGKRNVASRRLFYADEDTWSGLLCDIYDASGSLWKLTVAVPALLSDLPCMIGPAYILSYDFHAGTYGGLDYAADDRAQWKQINQLPSSFFTPGQLAALAGGN
jgi:hypothetical protein